MNSLTTIKRSLLNFSQRRRSQRQKQLAVIELQCLSDRQLADVGITRGTIKAAVYGQL